MNQPRHVRSSDRAEFFSAENTGFVTRKTSKGNQVLHYFTLALMVLVGTWSIVFFRMPAVGWIGIIILGVVMLLLGIEINQFKRKLFASEFLCALLASATGKGHKFCIISTLKGDIAYVNRPFQALFDGFAQQQQRKLEALCTQGKIAGDAREKITSLVYGNKDGTVKTKLEDEQGMVHSMTLTVSPILRPSGFVLILGD